MSDSPPQAPDDRLAIDLMVVTARFVRHMRRQAPEGESTATWRALAILDERGPLRVSEFADIDQLTQPAATAMMRRLVKEGAVARTPDPQDGRAFLLGLTDAGRARLEAFRTSGARTVMPALGALPSQDREQLQRAVATIDALIQHPTRAAKDLPDVS